jgi:myosin heavy subunit
MKRMSEAKPIFLRCIKPNASKKSNDFNDKFVLLQVIDLSKHSIRINNYL